MFKVQNYEDFSILLSAFLTNIIKNPDMNAKYTVPGTLNDLAHELKEIFEKKNEILTKAFFSHILHISKCKGLDFSFLNTRLGELKNMVVKKIDELVKNLIND